MTSIMVSQAIALARYVSAFLVFNALFFGTAMAQPLHGCENANVPFWIGTNNLKVFDAVTLARVTDCAGLLVLNGPAASGKGRYRETYPELVSEIKRRRPDLPVLAYSWLYQWHNTQRVGTDILYGLHDKRSWWLLDRRDLPAHRREFGPIYLDIFDPALRKQIVARISDAPERLGVDGIALDMVYRRPTQGRLGYWCRTNEAKCKSFSRLVEGLLRDIKQELGSRLLYVNGLWPRELVDPTSQLKLLDYVDGLAIEYFGMVPKKGHSSFSEDIEYYFPFMEVGGGKRMLVFGRAPWNGTTLAEDLAWGRYLYAAYLLAANENTMFKFHSTFQEPNTNGNLGGFHVLDVMTKNPGMPLRKRERVGDVYYRAFESVFVAVRPHDSGLEKPFAVKRIPIPERFERPTKTTLSPGDYLLLDDRGSD
jgi:hypothetical protein